MNVLSLVTKDLWNHQKEAAKKALQRKNYALFFEMGTGKTATAISMMRLWMWLERGPQTALIICPKIVVKQWGEEIDRWSKMGKGVVLLEGTGAKRAKILEEKMKLGKPMVIVANPATLLMKPVHKLLMQIKPKILVVDESHKFKNARAKGTKALQLLANYIPYKVILTGTPILNSPMDLFSQYKILDNGQTFGRNFLEFRAKYFEDKNADMVGSQKYFPNWVPRPGIEEEFNHKLKESSMHVKKEDCLDLPPLIKKKFYVEMSPEQKRVYKDLAKEFIAEFAGGAVVAQIALTKILRLQQVVSGFASVDHDLESMYVSKNTDTFFDKVPRLEALRDILEEISPNHKSIVWSCFKSNYKQIMSVCDELGIGYAQIFGGQTDKQREDDIERFRNDPNCRVMIANQKAGGVGLNLIEASYSIYYTRSYSLEDDLQSEARNYRGGSQVHEKVTRIDLVCSGSVDQLIMNALEKKQDLAQNILEFDPKSVMLK